MEQMDVIEGQGVDLSHVVIGHLATIKPEDNPLATHTAVARRGAFIGLDTLGHEMGRSDIPATTKVRMVQDLLDAGLEDHILLSSDQGNERQFKRYYGHGWSSVLMQFVPKLRFAGVPEETIRKILVDNPPDSPRLWRQHARRVPRCASQARVARIRHADRFFAPYASDYRHGIR